MERAQVITILESLANGVDPGSGARIPLDAFHSGDTVRALFAATSLLKDTQVAPKRGKAGARWTEEEDVRLCSEFDGGDSISKIAVLHGRTSGAITSRLVKLGRLDPEKVKARIH